LLSEYLLMEQYKNGKFQYWCFYGEITHNSTLKPRRTNTDIAQIVILYYNVDVSTMLFHAVYKDTVWPKMENENFVLDIFLFLFIAKF
jgi:hypothetical protein